MGLRLTGCGLSGDTARGTESACLTVAAGDTKGHRLWRVSQLVLGVDVGTGTPPFENCEARV